MPFAKSNFAIELDDLLPASSSTKEPNVEGFRPLCFKSGVFPGTRGTAFVEFGETRVLAQVNGPRENSEGDFHGASVIVSLSGEENKTLRAQLTSAVEGVIHLHKYAKSIISIDVSILSSDGGVLQAALVASSMALIHAGIEVLDVVLACHLAVTPSGEHLLDPCDAMTDGCADVTVAVMPNLNQIVCCDINGALTRSAVSEAVTICSKKALQLYPVLRDAIADGLS